MIKIETITIDDRQFTRTTSTTGMMIHKIGTNEIYSEALDVVPATYEETETPVPQAETTPEEMAAALGVLGVEV